MRSWRLGIGRRGSIWGKGEVPSRDFAASLGDRIHHFLCARWGWRPTAVENVAWVAACLFGAERLEGRSARPRHLAAAAARHRAHQREHWRIARDVLAQDALDPLGIHFTMVGLADRADSWVGTRTLWNEPTCHPPEQPLRPLCRPSVRC
jgi:hypothetical protein